MPSQCGPSLYSYGHRLTLAGDNRGALPLAPARALPASHPIRHRNHIFKTITQPGGRVRGEGGAGWDGVRVGSIGMLAACVPVRVSFSALASNLLLSNSRLQ